jgi:hypothetical protein
MEIFLSLIIKLIPFYIIIFLGFIAGKTLPAKKETFASILIYIIAPVIVFHGAVTTKITLATLSLPVVFYMVCCFVCLLFYLLAKSIWSDATKNILAFAAGSGNAGYFGLPVAVAIFGENVLGIVALIILAFILYENSLGFFITARGHHTIKESLIKIAKLPTIYTFIIGLLLNLRGITLGQVYFETIGYFRGAYTIMGMMLIGLGLSEITEYKFDIKFTAMTFLSKFVVWPIIILLIIFADNSLFKLYDPSIHKIMMLISIVPIAANTVAYATILRAHPDKASVAVLLTTLFALFYIPFLTINFLK